MSVRVSVVIPTYNRVGDISALLDDVAAQSEKDLEVLVVDDGSDKPHLSCYAELMRKHGERFRFLDKDPADKSKGPGAARNRGMNAAQGRFIAFCDDDDRWIRSDHLEVACASMEASGADMFWADLQTHHGEEVLNPSMYGHFSMLRQKQVSGFQDLFEVDRRALSQFLRHRIISCDSLVVKKSLVDMSGYYWDHLRFAEDHDFCFRLADMTHKALYRSIPIASANVSQHVSVARSIDALDRLLYGIMALNHAEAVLKDEHLISTARANRSWKLLELSEILAASKNKGAARRLVWESFFVKPSLAGMARCLRAI